MTVAPGGGAAVTRWVAVQDWPGGPRRLGEVALDEQGWLAIEGTAQEHASRLSMIVDAMNGAEALHVRILPPEGAGRYAVFTRQVRRGDPDFPSTLREQLMLYYDVHLDPV